ncbi:MAG: AarF/ABC1/UbiB kinase family protein, partial [Alphaproteobacteria bacterium]|nr:AarF/ABC1/UbiB kinase family protein [Alphaproteobacteria bacterium]
MSDEDSFTGRVRRYAQVGTAVGGLAARLAGERYLGIRVDRNRHAADLKAALGGIKGPLMKVAQLLATIPDALPDEYVRELIQLQSNAPAMGWPFVRRRMIGELGPDWERRFKSFEHEAARAASLGQVHRAVARDGAKLACKLQYPDMASAVEADLRQLRLAMGLYERYDRAVATADIHAEIAARLREELDYRREAAHMRLYGEILKDEPKVAVPRPRDELSTQRLLTMTWLDGEPILDIAKQAPLGARNEMALRMFRLWYVPFYFYGVIHGDPHLGNYTVFSEADGTEARVGGINLLDYGCIRIFPPKFVGGVVDLYEGLRTGDRGRIVHAYETWGFKGLRNDLIDTLNIWAKFIYGPLLEDRVRSIADGVAPSQYGRREAFRVHRALKERGPVKVPQEFVFMDRAAIGLGGVFLHLAAELNFHRLFNEALGTFDLAKVQRRQAEALARVGLK